MDRLSAQTAVTSWRKAELLLDTPLGEEFWADHLRLVAALRRRYVLCGSLSGLAAGALSFVGLSRSSVPLMILAMIAAPFVAWSWAIFARRTIAPFVAARRQWLPRLAFVALFEVVVPLDLIAPLSPTWCAIAAVAVALPWWISVLLEIRHRPPAYPSVWRQVVPAQGGRG